jgi:transposase
MGSKPIRTPDWRQIRRYRALELKREGWTREEIADALSVSERSVSKWMRTVREKGETGLLARPHLGATPKLSKKQQALLPGFLAQGASTYGFRGEVWTCARIALVIEWEFGVSSHKAHVSRLLKELDWTPQQPMTRDQRRNEQEIAHWRAEVWPALKKKRGARVGLLSA